MRDRKGFVFLLTSSACLIYAMCTGIRSNYGILLMPIVRNSGVEYSAVSFILAIAQLMFGIMQSVFGVAAMKKSHLFVLRSGIMMVAAGLFLLPFCKNVWVLLLVLGIIMPSGTAALSFGIIMAAITPKLPSQVNSQVSGIVTASSGVGSTVLSPVIQMLTAAGGLIGTVLFLGIPTLLLLPVSVFLCRPEQQTADSRKRVDSGNQGSSIVMLLKEAVRNKDYRCLMAGFFTCGFHMAIIETHLFSQITAYGYSEQLAAYTFSAYGIATMAGSVLSGILCSKVPMKVVLGDCMVPAAL